MKPQLLCLALTAAGVSFPAVAQQPVVLTSLSDRVRIEVGGRLFSEYIFTGAHRPYMYPILASDGTELNRQFPMKTPEGEDHDHPHHRSLWFAHSSVNGVDFWNEGTAGNSRPKGSIVHSGLGEVRSGKTGVIQAFDRWMAPDGTTLCTDETKIRIQGDERSRRLDYEVTLTASPSHDLLLGDDKDGTMAMRLAQWMTMPHTTPKNNFPSSGHILTSTGLRDGAAWGKRADWCDYYAEHNGQTYGIAIFDDPRNLRHPTWWMARDYGLFGANPFGQHDYEGLKDRPHAGDYTVPAGGSLTLRYGFYFHLGSPETAKVSEAYSVFVPPRK